MQAIGLLLAVAAGHGSDAAESSFKWIFLILRELGRSQAGGLIADLGQWSLLGAIAGFLLGIGASYLYSRRGCCDFPWRYARAARWAMYSTTTIGLAISFALIGFWTGATKGCERVLSKSQLGTDVFPKIADAIADGMAWVQIHEESGTNEIETSAMLEQFRSGARELHAAAFLQQLDRLSVSAVTDSLRRLEESALERAPALRGGTGEMLLHHLLPGLGRILVERKISHQMKSWGADEIYLAIRQRLTLEASKTGNPETISRDELSRFLVQEGIVPGIMKPLRATAHSNQVVLLLVSLAVLLIPLGIHLLNKRMGEIRTPKPAPALETADH